MPGEVGVGGEEGGGFIAGEGDEAEVAEARHGEVGEAGLAGAEERAGTTELEVDFGQFETVTGFFESLEPLVFARGIRSGEEEAI